MGSKSSKGLPASGSMFSYTTVEIHPEDVDLSEALGVKAPKENEKYDSAKMGVYFRITNLCWLLALFSLLFVLILTGFLMDARTNSTEGWSSDGSRLHNDRHVPVSSLHKKSLDLSRPAFVIQTTNSTSATPAIWGGMVVFPTWDGKLIGLEESEGGVVWVVDICADVYMMNVSTCDVEVKRFGRYLSRSTPAIWGDRIVVSINGPADVVVLNLYDGARVSTIRLDSNPFALVSQSGSVWNGQLYVGTSSNVTSECFKRRVAFSTDDSGCTFVGAFFRVDLESASVVWSSKTINPDGVLSGNYLGFSGAPVTGSSPAVSVRAGLVAFTTGNLTCWPQQFQHCVGNSSYESVHEDCYENHSFKYALFNSVVVLKVEDGRLFWHERFYGYRTWDVSCNHVPSNPCGGPCKFNNDRYKNCPTANESKNDDFEFSGNPILGSDRNGNEVLYVAQNSGLVLSLALNVQSISSANDRILWATQVLNGSGIGGMAADDGGIYFSVYNKRATTWFVDWNEETEAYKTTVCGGWGALNKRDGLPRWYAEHPKCGESVCAARVDQVGGYGSPTVTNDLILVASGDVLVDDGNEPIYIPPPPREVTRGGRVYSMCTETGKITSEYGTGAPFYKQGLSLKGRCAYGGNGYVKETDGKFYEGTEFFAWCVKSTHQRNSRTDPPE